MRGDAAPSEAGRGVFTGGSDEEKGHRRAEKVNNEVKYGQKSN